MQSKNSFYTVVLRPTPRGITRDELVSQHLARFGQVKNVRFGSGRGVAGDFMYIDYFEASAATTAVQALNGMIDPGSSNLKLTACLTSSTAESIKKLPVNIPDDPVKKTVTQQIETKVEGFLKYVKPKTTGNPEMCLLDLDAIP
jgi:hypothetical protein